MNLRLLLAGFVALAALIAWWLAGVISRPLPADGAVVIEAQDAAPLAGELRRPESFIGNRVPETSDENALDIPPTLDLEVAIPPWEQQIADVESARKATDTANSRAIFALLPKLPEEALVDATEKAVALLPDADYASVAMAVITNPRAHGRIVATLFADLMERPDAVTLPILLQIAWNSEHPFAPSAKSNLELLLNADFGSDWARWDQEIQKALVRPDSNGLIPRK